MSFTHILAADGSNERHLKRLLKQLEDDGVQPTAKVALWGSYLDNRAIADPYYGGLVCFLLVNSLRCSDVFCRMDSKLACNKLLPSLTHFSIKWSAGLLMIGNTIMHVFSAITSCVSKNCPFRVAPNDG